MYQMQNTDMTMEAVKLTADQSCLCCNAINGLDPYESVYAIPSNLKHFNAKYVYRLLCKALELPSRTLQGEYGIKTTMNAIMFADKQQTEKIKAQAHTNVCEPCGKPNDTDTWFCKQCSGSDGPDGV